MKILKDHRFQFFLFLLLFLVVNLLQSDFTLLFEDEAYYYIWSKDLAFGYFDHPPMVALWAATGQLFFDGEFGLRLLSSISFSLMLLIIWDTIDKKNKWDHVTLFFVVILSMTLWQVFGFIMTPDTPLIFFAAFFLWVYKRFLAGQSFSNSFLLGLAMAAMLYSKYHGILVIGFVVLSNFDLLKSKMFWMAGIIGLLLFMPHLHWQYENGFPSFVYHLEERGQKEYSIFNNFIHIVNMLVVVGITFPVIYKAFFKFKIKDHFDRALVYIVYGFFIFFFISAFKAEPQAQWVVLILIPLVLITFPYFIENLKARKWLVKLTLIQLFILLSVRIMMAIPSISPISMEPHVSEQWIPKLKAETEGKPIVFVNSYRNASLYNFYTGIDTHSYSILKGRKSQYNMLDFEANMQGDSIYSATYYVKDQPKLAKKNSRYIYGKMISDYNTFEKVLCSIASEEIKLTSGINEIEFDLINTYDKNITFENVKFVGVFQGFKSKIIAKVPLQINDLDPLNSKGQKTLVAKFELPELPEDEDITLRVALEFYNLLEGFQGNKVSVITTND